MVSFAKREKLSIKIEVLNIIWNLSLRLLLFAGTSGHLP